MEIKNNPQGTEEWFQDRLGKLTASHAQAIQENGKGLETYVYQKVAERISGKTQDNYSNNDLERGNELENTARASYEMETGNKVKQVGFCELNKDIGASPDGIIGKDGLIEIKCPRDYNYIKVLFTNKVDKKYQWQMQMQLYITNRKWCDYVVFHENFPNLIIIKIKRDEEMIEKIKTGLESGIKMINKIIKKVV